jgi:hypothetical protein
MLDRERQHGQVTRPFDGLNQTTLVVLACAGHAPGHNLAMLSEKLAEHFRSFKIDRVLFVRTETTSPACRGAFGFFVFVILLFKISSHTKFLSD